MSLSDTLLNAYPHIHHFSEITWSACHHLFIVKETQCFQEYICHFLFFQRRANLSSDFTSSLRILFEGFFVFLGHRPNLTSIWSHVHILLILLDKRFSQVIKSVNLHVIQAHVPFHCITCQIVFEVMNQQLIVVFLGGHPLRIHSEMDVGTRISFVFLEFR